MFNLLDEPWIPVIDCDGSWLEVGLMDMFARSATLHAIWTPDALTTLALHRLAIAVTLAALTAPVTPDGSRRDLDEQRIDIIDADGLPVADVLAYLNAQRSRFWLFGPEPFWQLRAAGESDDPVARLHPLHAVKANAAFYDHHHELAAAVVSDAHAARMLTVAQVFSKGRGGGFTNGLFGENKLMAVLAADTMLGTVTANLVTYFATDQPQDAPVWERSREERKRRRDKHNQAPLGLLDMLTWEPRAIKLRRMAGGGVSRAFFGGGIRVKELPELVREHRSDPWMPITVKNDKPAATQGKAGRAIWRDSYAILLGLSSQHKPAGVPSVLASARDRVDGKAPFAILAGGLVSEQGGKTLATAVLSRFVVPPGFLNAIPVGFLAGLEQMVQYAEQTEQAAKRALRCFASEHRGNPAHARSLADAMWKREESAYWATGGRAFTQHAARLASAEPASVVLKSWQAILRAAALTAVRRNTGCYTDAAGLRAAALADQQLLRSLPRPDKKEKAP